MSRKEASKEASEAGRVLRAQREAEAETTTRPEGERPAPRNEERREAMEEVLRRDLETKAKDGIKIDEDEPVKTETVPEAKTEVAPEVTTEVTTEAPAEPEQPEVVAAPMVKVKILGEEREVPQSEIDEYGTVKSYQIAKANEAQMREARELAAESKRTQENLVRYLQQQMQPQVQQKTPQQVILDHIAELQYGNPEQAAAAWQKIQEATSQKVDPNQIIRSAVMQMQEQQAMQEFRREFPEIAAEPRLEKFASMLGVEKAQKMFKEGKVPEWSSFYRDLGNEVRSLVGRPNQSAAPAPTTGQTSSVPSAKDARKASITVLPTSSQRAEVKKEEKPESREDIFNEMKAKRDKLTG